MVHDYVLEKGCMICMVIRATLSLYTCIFKKYWGFPIHCPLQGRIQGGRTRHAPPPPPPPKI